MALATSGIASSAPLTLAVQAVHPMPPTRRSSGAGGGSEAEAEAAEEAEGDGAAAALSPRWTQAYSASGISARAVATPVAARAPGQRGPPGQG